MRRARGHKARHKTDVNRTTRSEQQASLCLRARRPPLPQVIFSWAAPKAKARPMSTRSTAFACRHSRWTASRLRMNAMGAASLQAIAWHPHCRVQPLESSTSITLRLHNTRLYLWIGKQPTHSVDGTAAAYPPKPSGNWPRGAPHQAKKHSPGEMRLLIARRRTLVEF